jgi:hypothetical protein
MLTYKAKLTIWFITLGMILACVPTFATPPPPSDPAAVNTFIAQTVNAASSQTAAVMPTSTATATTTPTPRNTDTVTPTSTPTVIFILSSPTPIVIPTFTAIGIGGGTSTSSSDYACQVLSVSPANGTTFNPRTDFDGVWKVKNIGQKKWDRNDIDYRYTSGAKLQTTDIYDLSSNVNRSETIDLIVDMRAPKNSGNFTTIWNLYIGSKAFCNMTLTINVR